MDGDRRGRDGTRSGDRDLGGARRALPRAKRRGLGSAQAIDEVGGPSGIAILGSVVGAGYIAHLNLATFGACCDRGPPERLRRHGGRTEAPLASAARVGPHRVREGMHAAFLVSAGIALAGAVLAMLFLPRPMSGRSRLAAATNRGGDIVGAR